MPFAVPPTLRVPRPRPNWRRRLMLEAVAGAALMLAAHAFVIQVSVVRGHSMEPCLHDGDRLVVDRVCYGLGDVTRGDVVVLRYPRDPAIDFVKRVVAVAGDRVAMRGGVLRVNGAPCDDYGSILDVQELAERVIPANHVFVLGDNRPISCDSREFGLVPVALLRGKVRMRFWPLGTAAVF